MCEREDKIAPWGLAWAQAGAVVPGLSRDNWAGLRSLGKHVEGSHKFQFGDIEHEVPLGQELERCQGQKDPTCKRAF